MSNKESISELPIALDTIIGVYIYWILLDNFRSS